MISKPIKAYILSFARENACGILIIQAQDNHLRDFNRKYV
jgi:hypothetical protein